MPDSLCVAVSVMSEQSVPNSLSSPSVAAASVDMNQRRIETKCGWVALAVLAFLLATVATTDNARNRQNFRNASERCFQRENLSAQLKRRFDLFIYPDEPAVHRFVHCLLVDLQLWDDRSGLDVAQIAALYKANANSEVLIPILSACNRNTTHEQPLRWCYGAFRCILGSRVGQWFKNDIGGVE